MENPIRYQDLISPDDSIEKLIGQLEQLNTAYTTMAGSVRQQAADLSSSLKKVSGATSEGRTAISGASEEAKRLAKAYADLEYATSDTAKRVAELKEIQKEQNMMNKLSAQSARAVEGSYNALSAQYRINKMLINNLTQAERENDPAAKKLIEDTRRIYDEMNKMQQATGKFSLNVGNYEQSIINAVGINSKWYQGMQQLGALFEGGFSKGVAVAGDAIGAFGKKLLALMMNPVVATIAAITAAFMALARGISTSEENTNALNRVLAPFERILTGITNVLQTMAGWLLKAVEGMESLAMGASRLAERLPIVGKAFRSVNTELQKNIDLERERQQLTKDNRELTKKEAKTQYEIAVLRRKANETDDPKERAALLQKAVRKERQMSNERVAILQRELKVLKEKAKQSQNDAATNDEIARKEAEIWNARTQAEQRSLRMVRQISTAEHQMNKSKVGGGGGKVDTSEADVARQQLEERRKIEDAKIALVEDANMRERMVLIASYDRKIEDLKGSEQYIAEMTVLLEQQKQEKLAELFEKEAQQQRDQEKKKADIEQQAKRDALRVQEQQQQEQRRLNDIQYDIDMEGIEQLETSEKEKTRMRLEAEKERLKKLLALYEADGSVLAQKEAEMVRTQIAGVDKELEKNKKSGDIYDMLGFKLDDEQKEAINESLSYAIDSVNQFMDSYVAAAEKKKELADAEVERAQSNLEKEIEARNNGYANEVETARKELEQARKNQQKATENARRAQRAQEAIDTATQVSSLVTASANIWKSLSGIPGFGTALAIAAVATMWSSFAASKVMARQAAGAGDEEYGEGTVELLQGGSHQSGNDVDLGRKPNGVRRRAEGGEFFAVINKRSSRRFRSVIPDVVHSLNDGTFAEKYMDAYKGGDLIVNEERTADLTRLQDDVRMIREQGEMERYVDGNGNTVMRYKNLRRIIRR